MGNCLKKLYSHDFQYDILDQEIEYTSPPCVPIPLESVETFQKSSEKSLIENDQFSI